MLTIKSAKIDKYYLILLLILIPLGGLTIFAFNRIFSSFATAYELALTTKVNPKVDEVKLEETYSWVFSNKVIKVNLR